MAFTTTNCTYIAVVIRRSRTEAASVGLFNPSTNGIALTSTTASPESCETQGSLQEALVQGLLVGECWVSSSISLEGGREEFVSRAEGLPRPHRLEVG